MAPPLIDMADDHGHTLLELVAALAIAALLAAVVVPGAASVDGRLAVDADAHRFVQELRRAQARAAATGEPVRVELADGGAAFLLTDEATAARLGGGRFGGPTCSTNYPGGALEFSPSGWPCAVGGAPRAGTFTFSYAGVTRSVVLQLGGRVRVS